MHTGHVTADPSGGTAVSATNRPSGIASPRAWSRRRASAGSPHRI